jgi:hypothetical protein
MDAPDLSNGYTIYRNFQRHSKIYPVLVPIVKIKAQRHFLKGKGRNFVMYSATGPKPLFFP